VSALVFVTEAAERQIYEARQWYERNASTDALDTELEHALALLAEAPGVGAPFTRARRPGTLRLLLRPTRHWLYYTVDPRRDVVYVLAFWSNRRDGRPPGI
jgi:plasmid stabilization system protein ParE